jgi:hypothetical protein
MMIAGNAFKVGAIVMRHSKPRKIVRRFQPNTQSIFRGPNQDRRDDIRRDARQHVSIQFRNLRLICDLVDLSEEGAKIRVLDGIVPNLGDDVALTLFDGMTIDGRVSWLREKHIGIEFLDAISNVEDRLDFENLGREYFGRAVILQKAVRRPSR